MANPDITLLNATYSGVSGVTLPKNGGGTATFPWVEGSQTITTNNTYDVTNLAEVVVNVSGGGGASNVVTGTFKGTTTGAAMDVTLNYTGNGYPVAVVVYPKEGTYKSGTGIYDLVQRYAVIDYFAAKCDISAVPSFNTQGTNGTFTTMRRYKSSATSATSYSSATANDTAILLNADATGSGSSGPSILRIKSKTKMSVYIADSAYGFAANYDYTYWVLYSS